MWDAARLELIASMLDTYIAGPMVPAWEPKGSCPGYSLLTSDTTTIAVSPDGSALFTGASAGMNSSNYPDEYYVYGMLTIWDAVHVRPYNASEWHAIFGAFGYDECTIDPPADQPLKWIPV